MRLYVIRHGDSFYNAMGLAEGHLDSGLTRAALDYTFEVAETLAAEDPPVRRIFTSDLPRAFYTGALIAEGLGLPPSAVERSELLREVDYGTAAGTPFDELDPVYLEDMTVPFPGGESRDAMRRRVLGFLARRVLRTAEGAVLVVVHGGGHRAVLSEYAGEDFRGLYGGPLPKLVHRFDLPPGEGRNG